MSDDQPATFDLTAEAEALLDAGLTWQTGEDPDRPHDEDYWLEEARYQLTQLMVRGWRPPQPPAKPPQPPSGPYQTERETYTSPLSTAVKELHDSGRVRSGDPDHVLRGTTLSHLVAACSDAHLTLGELDMRVLRWLAGGEPHVCEVIIGLIRRAHAAGEDRHH